MPSRRVKGKLQVEASFRTALPSLTGFYARLHDDPPPYVCCPASPYDAPQPHVLCQRLTALVGQLNSKVRHK